MATLGIGERVKAVHLGRLVALCADGQHRVRDGARDGHNRHLDPELDVLATQGGGVAHDRAQHAQVNLDEELILQVVEALVDDVGDQRRQGKLGEVVAGDGRMGAQRYIVRGIAADRQAKVGLDGTQAIAQRLRLGTEARVGLAVLDVA